MIVILTILPKVHLSKKIINDKILICSLYTLQCSHICELLYSTKQEAVLQEVKWIMVVAIGMK